LIERWSAAVRAEDYSAIRADHHEDLQMFDVPLPLQSRGLDAYMKTWDLFFQFQMRPINFDFEDVEITAGFYVAFATAIGRCINIDQAGKPEPLVFRLTMGLKKIGGQWCVMHEHHSLPAT
jgi:ketosteroid isomerase-like protein